MKAMNVSIAMKMKKRLFRMLGKEMEFVEGGSVSCQGHEAPYDHPLVYLQIKEDAGKIDCPYCGKEFILKR
jgi:uncharacterized Zn-finger protein